MKSSKPQIFHRKNVNPTLLKVQPDNLNSENVDHAHNKRAFHRKPQPKVNPFSEVESNRTQFVHSPKNNKLNQSILSNTINFSTNKYPSKFVRKGSQSSLHENNEVNSRMLSDQSQNFGQQSLIISKRSPDKILDNSYLDQVLSMKSIQKVKQSAVTYITKKKSLQNMLDVSCVNSVYLDFIQECESTKQQKSSQLIRQQNQKLKIQNQRLTIKLGEVQNDVFKLKKRVNYLQSKMSSARKLQIQNEANDANSQNLQNMIALKTKIKEQFQTKIKQLQDNQKMLLSQLRQKQNKISNLQQNVQNLFQIIGVKEKSQHKLHDYLDSYKSKINEISEQLRYRQIQNTILLKIRQDYLSLTIQSSKIKDQRNYFKLKIVQLKKLNSQLMKQCTNNKPIKKKQKNIGKNKFNQSFSTQSTSQPEYLDQAGLNNTYKTKTYSRKNEKSFTCFQLSSNNGKDQILFDLSESQNGECD